MNIDGRLAEQHALEEKQKSRQPKQCRVLRTADRAGIRPSGENNHGDRRKQPSFDKSEHSWRVRFDKFDDTAH
jgi:hypothetical protein